MGMPSGKMMLRIFLAEFLGTLILVLFGDAAIVEANYQGTIFLHVAFGYGIALMIGILVSGGVSGGHLNPAVTLGLVSLGKCHPVALPVYWAAQYLGAFTGAAIVYGVYYDLINDLQTGPFGLSDITVAGYFATYPASFGPSYTTLSFDQMLGTAALMVIILAVTDKKNIDVPMPLVPLLIGLGLTAIHISFAANAGCAINPARDFGPRLLTWIVWGGDIWQAPIGSDTEYWFWIPWILPHLGALFGAICYVGFISLHHEKEIDVGMEQQQRRRKESNES